MTEYLRRQWTTALVALTCVLNTVRYAVTGDMLWAVLFGVMAGALTSLLIVMGLLWWEGQR